MPKATPTIKVRNVERLGAKVVLHGEDFDEAKIECARLASTHGLIFVPPYDDPLVIAGQGTVGLEILKQINSADTLDGIFGAIGGGGLVAGIAEYVKRIGDPRVKIIGVETLDGDAMARSIQAGQRVTLKEVGPFSDGTAVKIVGEEPFRLCKKWVDGVVKVDNDAICAAIKDIFEGSLCLFIIDLICSARYRYQIYYRTCRRVGVGWIEALHCGEWPRRRSQALCCCCQRGEHELWETTVCG